MSHDGGEFVARQVVEHDVIRVREELVEGGAWGGDQMLKFQVFGRKACFMA